MNTLHTWWRYLSNVLAKGMHSPKDGEARWRSLYKYLLYSRCSFLLLLGGITTFIPASIAYAIISSVSYPLSARWFRQCPCSITNVVPVLLIIHVLHPTLSFYSNFQKFSKLLTIIWREDRRQRLLRAGESEQGRSCNRPCFFALCFCPFVFLMVRVSAEKDIVIHIVRFVEDAWVAGVDLCDPCDAVAFPCDAAAVIRGAVAHGGIGALPIKQKHLIIA